jgi:electron transport complex protein RnfG
MKKTPGIAILALLAGLGIGATYLVQINTTARIEAQRQIIANRTLLDVLPAGQYDNQPLAQSVVAAPVVLPHSTLLNGYLATRGGQPTAVLLRSQALGYEGSIELLVAIDPTGRLLGVKTLRQSETPGLGAAIAGWALKKDQGQFDQLAGATVTFRAVLEAVHDALRYFDEHTVQLTGAIEHD